MTDKFCKDCKYYERTILDRDRCYRPVALRRKDLVRGAQEASLDKSALLERLEFRPMFKWLFPDNCGPDAKYFEPRKFPDFPHPMKGTKHD
jgi:hypothetical protein